jgi:hypothetical protein
MNKYLIYLVALQQTHLTGEHTGRYTVVVDPDTGDGVNQPAVYLDREAAEAYKARMQALWPDETYEVLTSVAYSDKVFVDVETHPTTPQRDANGSLTAG